MTRRLVFFKFSSLILILASLGCAKGFQSKSLSSENSQSSEGTREPSPDPDPSPEPRPGPDPFVYQPLLWEPVRSDSKAWSEFLYSILKTDARALLEARDFDRFCSKYKFLTFEQQINVAGMLISALVKYETNFNPVARYQETTMGTDAVTGLPVYSEGLMQLSYQDVTGWSFCEFDWNKDKNLSPLDPLKTILDPYKNLACGTRILARQIETRGQIVLSSGAYWAVIKQGGSNEKIDEISALVNNLEFCH